MPISSCVHVRPLCQYICFNWNPQLSTMWPSLLGKHISVSSFIPITFKTTHMYIYTKYYSPLIVKGHPQKYSTLVSHISFLTSMIPWVFLIPHPFFIWSMHLRVDIPSITFKKINFHSRQCWNINSINCPRTYEPSLYKTTQTDKYQLS